MSNKNQDQTETFTASLGAAIDNLLQEEFGEQILFTIILWSGPHSERTNYVSNAIREDIIKALRETATRLEANLDAPPGTKTSIRDN